MNKISIQTPTLGAIGVALALSLGAMGAAQAAALTNVDTLAPMSHSQSTKSRAEVRAELKAALVAGELRHSELDTYRTPMAASTLTREQVRQDTAAWKMSPAGNRPELGY